MSYRKDVVKLMMLLCKRCGYLEDVALLMMLLRRSWCYVEDVAMLKILFCRCCASGQCIQNGLVDVKKKERHVHLALDSPMKYDIFVTSKKLLNFANAQLHFFLARRNQKEELQQINKTKNVDNIPQVCVPHRQHAPCIMR